jgi:hypothetical protein
MCRVDTSTVEADVIHHKIIRDGSLVDLVRDAMCLKGGPSKMHHRSSNHAVPVRFLGGDPLPAVVIPPAVYFLPEAVFEGARLASTHLLIIY